MTLSFNKNVINDTEITPDNFNFAAKFIGFLDPSGRPIDYSCPFGIGGHDINPVTELFLDIFYVNEIDINMDKEQLILRNKRDEEYITDASRDYILECISRVNSEIRFESRFGEYPITLLKKNLLTFFNNCYKNKYFTKGFGKDVNLLDKESYNILYLKNQSNERTLDIYYDDYKYRQMLYYLNDIYVQYLGYHRVERLPKTITTSEFKIYETFYNYFLNDFNVVRIPKMIYSDDEKMYKEYRLNEFLVPESELILKDEIESIKKMVPLNERYKYYR